MRLLLEWLRGAGFEQLSQQFFAKLTSVANLVAMPGSQLLQVRCWPCWVWDGGDRMVFSPLCCLFAQMTWPTLRAEFPALSPAQLHRVLSQCQAAMEVGNVAAWQPWGEESTATFQPGEPPPACCCHPKAFMDQPNGQRPSNCKGLVGNCGHQG